jgi:hypothetical protein
LSFDTSALFTPVLASQCRDAKCTWQLNRVKELVNHGDICAQLAQSLHLVPCRAKLLLGLSALRECSDTSQAPRRKRSGPTLLKRRPNLYLLYTSMSRSEFWQWTRATRTVNQTSWAYFAETLLKQYLCIPSAGLGPTQCLDPASPVLCLVLARIRASCVCPFYWLACSATVLQETSG